MKRGLNPVAWAALSGAAFLMLGLTTCAAIAKPALSERGGAVQDYVDYVENARLDPSLQNPRLDGRYYSAATLFLAIEGACVTPDSVFSFHGPSAATAGIGLTLAEFDRVSGIMSALYSEASAELGQWFWGVGRHRIGKDFYRVTGAELIKAGVTACQ